MGPLFSFCFFIFYIFCIFLKVTTSVSLLVFSVFREFIELGRCEVNTFDRHFHFLSLPFKFFPFLIFYLQSTILDWGLINMVGFNYTKVSLFQKVIRTLFKSGGSLIALSYQEAT